MNARDLMRRIAGVEKERSDWPVISMQQWADMFNPFMSAGMQYTLPTAKQESIGWEFQSLARAAYKTNGPVFACMLVRMLLFCEARFQFRQLRDGRPGDLFGTQALQPLETPWSGATTGDMLARAIQYADLSGNAYLARRGQNIVPLRPDWTWIVGGVPGSPRSTVWDIDAEVIGYLYQPGGPGAGRDPIPLAANEVAHFAPIPDPEARFRGMSWLAPIVREVMGDKAATEHKLMFFENGATPQMVVNINADDLKKFTEWVAMFREQHEGASNAYKTLFLGAGHSATVVGKDLEQVDFKRVQGAGETRIAAAAGVPPILVGLSEGLESATYSNYGMARRRFADGTMRPLWRNMAGSLARIIDVPGGSELWYDDRDIAFIKEDQKDAADVQFTQAQTIRQLVDAGYDSDSVVAAVTSGDFSKLAHTGLFSVQLQPAGTTPKQGLLKGTPVPEPGANGNGNGSAKLPVGAA